ncbi:MAG: response regulator [Caldilineaceae bacterium]
MTSKILVIEDNQNILEEVLTWLELEGYEAFGAANGSVGVQVALNRQPDLILCDIMMPEKDGYRVLLELRANKSTALTPFIFMTAKQEKSDIRYGMELGADDYITKPFSREEFLGAIRSRLERHHLFASHSQERLTNLRDNLFRSLPHELRTPLVGILGIGQLLAQDAEIITPPEILEYAQMLTTCGEQLYRLTENHLLYVQLAQQTNYSPSLTSDSSATVVDPLPIIEDCCNRVAQIRNRSRDLRFSLSAGKLCINAIHLTKILYEITDNAFKFSAPSTLVTVASQQEEQRYLITITDHGYGFKADDIARIGPYIQFDRNLHEQQGAGLGLTIARLLTESYRGTLQIASSLGAGTRITLSWPRV